MSVFTQFIILSVLIVQLQSLKLKKRSYDDNNIAGNENVVIPNDVIQTKWEQVDDHLEWDEKLRDETTEEYKKAKLEVERKVSDIEQLSHPLNLNPKFEKTQDNKVKVTVALLLVPENEPDGQRRYKRGSVEDFLGQFGGTSKSPGEIDDTCGEDDICIIDHTECVLGYCQCMDDYVNEDGVKDKCHPVRELGEPCEIQKQCHGDGQKCGNPSKICECKGGTYEHIGVCYPLQQELHEVCVADDQCAIKNSVCVAAAPHSTCECDKGFEESKDRPNTCYDPSDSSVRTECGSKPNLRCVSKESCDSEHEMEHFDCPLKNDVCCDKCETLESQGDLSSSCIPRHECPYPYRKKGHCDIEGENCCLTCETSLDLDCVSSDECPEHLQRNLFCSYKSDVCCRTCGRLGGHCVHPSRCLEEDQDPDGSYCPNNLVCCLN